MDGFKPLLLAAGASAGLVLIYREIYARKSARLEHEAGEEPCQRSFNRCLSCIAEVSAGHWVPSSERNTSVLLPWKARRAALVFEQVTFVTSSTFGTTPGRALLLSSCLPLHSIGMTGHEPSGIRENEGVYNEPGEYFENAPTKRRIQNLLAVIPCWHSDDD